MVGARIRRGGHENMFSLSRRRFCGLFNYLLHTSLPRVWTAKNMWAIQPCANKTFPYKTTNFVWNCTHFEKVYAKFHDEIGDWSWIEAVFWTWTQSLTSTSASTSIVSSIQNFNLALPSCRKEVSIFFENHVGFFSVAIYFVFFSVAWMPPLKWGSGPPKWLWNREKGGCMVYAHLRNPLVCNQNTIASSLTPQSPYHTVFFDHLPCLWSINFRTLSEIYEIYVIWKDSTTLAQLTDFDFPDLRHQFLKPGVCWNWSRFKHITDNT